MVTRAKIGAKSAADWGDTRSLRAEEAVGAGSAWVIRFIHVLLAICLLPAVLSMVAVSVVGITALGLARWLGDVQRWIAAGSRIPLETLSRR
jgi:hypothetical protein